MLRCRTGKRSTAFPSQLPIDERCNGKEVKEVILSHRYRTGADVADILTGNWIGDLRGTIVANLYVEFSVGPKDIQMIFRAGGSSGATIFQGSVADAVADQEFVLTSLNMQQPVVIKITFHEITQESISGRWEMLDGNAGIFRLNPVAMQSSSSPTLDTTENVRFITRTGALPRMRIYRDEVHDLIAIMKARLPTPFQVVVRTNLGGKDVNVLSPDLWTTPGLPRVTSVISLSLTEPANPTARAINITVGTNGTTYSVSGPDEVWVAGVFEEIRSMHLFKRRMYRAFYEENGLSINLVLVLLAVAYSPDLPFARRIVLLSAAIGLALIFRHFYNLTTASEVHLRDDRKVTSWVDVPRLITGLVGAAIVALVPYLNSLLSGDLLQRLLGP